MKLSVFVGTSLDGFIARRNGQYDFLPLGGGEPHGYEAFMASVDTILIGRNYPRDRADKPRRDLDESAGSLDCLTGTRRGQTHNHTKQIDYRCEMRQELPVRIRPLGPPS
jgi:hypothetical protein